MRTRPRCPSWTTLLEAGLWAWSGRDSTWASWSRPCTGSSSTVPTGKWTASCWNESTMNGDKWMLALSTITTKVIQLVLLLLLKITSNNNYNTMPNHYYNIYSHYDCSNNTAAITTTATHCCTTVINVITTNNYTLTSMTAILLILILTLIFW